MSDEKKEFHPTGDPMGISSKETVEYHPKPVFGDDLKITLSSGESVAVDRYATMLKHYGGEEMVSGKPKCYIYIVNVEGNLKEFENRFPGGAPRRFKQFSLLYKNLLNLGLKMPDGWKFPDQTAWAYFSDDIREGRHKAFLELLEAASVHPEIRVSDEFRQFVGVQL